MQDTITKPLLKWYGENKRVLPWREKKNPYEIWVSEIMLQQTRVEAVKPFYERFMRELPNVAATCGLSRGKAFEALGRPWLL